MFDPVMSSLLRVIFDPGKLEGWLSHRPQLTRAEICFSMKFAMQCIWWTVCKEHIWSFPLIVSEHIYHCLACDSTEKEALIFHWVTRTFLSCDEFVFSVQESILGGRIRWDPQKLEYRQVTDLKFWSEVEFHLLLKIKVLLSQWGSHYELQGCLSSIPSWMNYELSSLSVCLRCFVLSDWL